MARPTFSTFLALVVVLFSAVSEEVSCSTIRTGNKKRKLEAAALKAEDLGWQKATARRSTLTKSGPFSNGQQSLLQTNAGQLPPGGVHDSVAPNVMSIPYYGPKDPSPLTYHPTSLPSAPVYQPYDAAGGAPAVPTEEPPPPIAPAAPPPGCPGVLIPSKLVVRAPSGCDQTNRHDLWTSEISAPIVNWQANCFAMPMPKPDITFKSSITNERLFTTRTRPTATTQEIDITDCNFAPQYRIHEVLYKKAGPALTACGNPPCGDLIYVKWFIMDMASQKIIAMSEPIPLFARKFNLLDTTGRIVLASIEKNGDWSPLTKCPDYSKHWMITFPDELSVEVQNAAADSLLLPSKRWVVAAMVTQMALRDDSRRGDGLVTHIGCPLPLLDSKADVQPIDTAIGNDILSQFVGAPTVTPPPTQAAIDFVHGCFPRALANRMVVQAPSGCETTGRHAAWTNTSSAPIVSWNETTFAYNRPDLTLTDVVSNKLLTTTSTQKNAYTNAVDITDCNLNVLYTMHEEVYKKVGQSNLVSCRRFGSCDGEIYLRYMITSRTGKVVAITSYLPLFVNEFKLIDPSGGVTIATIKKNGDWNPQEKCPEYQKQWIITFSSSATTTDASSVGLMTQDKRWIIATFVTQMALRDDSRTPDGQVQFTVSQTATWSSISVFIFLGIALVLFAIMMFIRLKWRESCIKGCLGVQHVILPRVMAKPLKHGVG